MGPNLFFPTSVSTKVLVGNGLAKLFNIKLVMTDIFQKILFPTSYHTLNLVQRFKSYGLQREGTFRPRPRFLYKSQGIFYPPKKTKFQTKMYRNPTDFVRLVQFLVKMLFKTFKIISFWQIFNICIFYRFMGLQSF